MRNVIYTLHKVKRFFDVTPKKIKLFTSEIIITVYDLYLKAAQPCMQVTRFWREGTRREILDLWL